ncbi:unnamed protein product [Candidula unifasciata]|uniref:Neprilysin n=1 Tax=Candidula unifasciata TaxID=100452 RepID=A0A8S3YI64_9EUPU|nr:unnamed protein product [Candidula unifasciata]
MTDSSPPGMDDSSNPAPHSVTFTDKTSSKSRVYTLISILATVFFVTTVIFVVLFAVYYTKYVDETKVTKDNHEVSDKKVCYTPDCVIAAGMMANKMDFTVDPCEDFNQFACGRFLKEAALPIARNILSPISALADENKLIMKDIITEDIIPTQPQYLTNMKRMFRSCNNEAQIEKIGLDPYLKDDRTFVDDWPTLNPSWNNASFKLNEVIARYERVYIEPIFSYYTHTDMTDSNKTAYILILQIKEGILGLSTEDFSKPRNDSVIIAYEKYLAETAIALNANRTIAEQDARDVVDLEIELSKITFSAGDTQNSSEHYIPVLLGNLSGMFPELDIPGAIRAAFETANISLGDDERVINQNPTYFGNISSVVRRFSSRALQNLFGFKYALSRVDRLTARMRQIRLPFDQAIGAEPEGPRWDVCLNIVNKAFWKGMGRQFVDKVFSDTAKSYIEQMIYNVKAEFRKIVEEKTWMSNATKVHAIEKLDAMSPKVGYPDRCFEKADIEEFYENYTMNEGHYYNNRVLINKLDNFRLMRALRTLEDKSQKWQATLYDANAYNDIQENEIVFPAGFLRSPIFSETFQNYMNYGTIGTIIGHEITHGFENNGYRFDAHGDIRDWWQPEELIIFMDKMQCIVDQNNNFRIYEINMTVNGTMTQGDSVSDNGGVKQSFRAYKELVRNEGEQPRLPGLGLTQDQIFFLAWGQVWCEKATPYGYIQQITKGVHPPGKFRIIGPLQNSPEFAKAYNCSLGSYMNPVKKCEVW